MKAILYFFICVFGSNALAGELCVSCKQINEMIQNIQLENDAGRQIDMMADLGDYIRKMKLSKDEAIKTRQYKTLFNAIFKLEQYDMDLEIPYLTSRLMRRRPKEFMKVFGTLSKNKQKRITARMKLVNVYIHFGEGKKYMEFVRDNSRDLNSVGEKKSKKTKSTKPSAAKKTKNKPSVKK